MATERFFCCYLLCSLAEGYSNHAYIGFTVNPARRIRQHNGYIKQGAKQTKKKRPWEMVLCVYGFPTKHAALYFEWSWQNPREGKGIRDVVAQIKNIGNENHIPAKIRFNCLLEEPHSE
uniref:GIY-YIG domain-containing protein n=1 Tax=Arcella intermedia TaxID=1963864 RepID=A0A6B2LS06_9EUKA